MASSVEEFEKEIIDVMHFELFSFSEYDGGRDELFNYSKEQYPNTIPHYFHLPS